jgi:hypothetical protein
MSALTVQEAETLLSDAQLEPCVEGGLLEMKELVNACLDAGIPAIVGADACESGSCAPKARLVVRSEDLERARVLLRDRWLASVESLGVGFAGPPVQDPEQGTTGSDEVRCPACGTAGPLVHGACSDCGLQLE